MADEREAVWAYNLHGWMRFGGLTRCGKCGAFMTTRNSASLCSQPDTPGLTLMRSLGRRALAAGRSDGGEHGT